MAEYILMPTLGFDMEEGTMGAWMKNVGDAVEVGDVLAEIESDKVTQELQARHAGVLLAVFANEGEDVPVGSNLGVIGEEGEDISSMTDGQSAAKGQRSEGAKVEGGSGASAETVSNSLLHRSKNHQVKHLAASSQAASKQHRLPAVSLPIKASTYSKSMVLAPVGVSPNQTLSNLSKAVAHLRLRQHAHSRRLPHRLGPETEEVPLTRLRKAIARRMTESKQTVPHFQVTSAIDMTEALALRKQINAALPEGEKVSVNDMIVKACGCGAPPISQRQFKLGVATSLCATTASTSVQPLRLRVVCSPLYNTIPTSHRWRRSPVIIKRESAEHARAKCNPTTFKAAPSQSATSAHLMYSSLSPSSIHPKQPSLRLARLLRKRLCATVRL